MIISPSREFVFIHLEKCGGTSVETALEPYLHWSDIILGSTDFGESYQQLLNNRFGNDQVKKYMLWKHSTAEDIFSFIGLDMWREFRKISVVREPVDLIKSLYFFSQTAVNYHIGRVNYGKWKEFLRTNKFPESWPYNEPFVHAYAKSYIDGSGIDGFVKEVLGNAYDFVSPQYERIQVLGKADLDIVIDLSTLNDRWADVSESVGIVGAGPIGHLNSSERDDIELSHKSIKAIKRHFAVDYQELPRYTGVYW